MLIIGQSAMDDKKLIACVFIFSFSSAAEEIDLFDLSLEDLLKIKIQGESVNNINLNKIYSSSNPFNQSIIDIPFSIEVMGNETISAKGLKNIVQVVENMTGVLSGESPSEPYSFSTRGFSRDSIDVNYDGISMGVSTLNMRPQSTFNVERVEFIKGLSTLNHGQGASGGTVNIVTKKAKESNHHTKEFLVMAGEYGSQSYNVGINGPISENFFYRLDASHSKLSGWVDDTSSDSTNISSSILYKPQSNIDLTLSLISLDDKLPAYWGTPFVPSNIARYPNNGIISSESHLLIDEDTRFNNYNVEDKEIASDSLWLKFDFEWDINADIHVNAKAYKFSANRFWKNSESYFYNADIEKVERDRLLVSHDRDNKGFYSEVIFNHALFEMKSKSSVKLEFKEIDFYREVGFNLASPSLYWDSVDLFEPEKGSFGYVDKRNDSLNERTSGIVFNNLLTIDDVNLNTSIRYENIDFNRHYINWDGTVRKRATIDTSFDQFSYFLGMSKKIFKESSIYGNISSGYESAFADYRFTYDLKNMSLSSVNQFEVGYKGVIGKTEFTLAYYDIQKEINTQISANSKMEITERSSKGIDFSFATKLSKALKIGGDFAYVDAEFGNAYDAEIGVVVDGLKPMNVPERIANLNIAYQFESLPVEIGGGMHYVSSRMANPLNTIELKSYFRNNIYITYHGDNYYLSLHVNNLSDEIYAPWSDKYYTNQIIIASPKVIELSFRIKL
jgi:iron complex outermembrane receptor protein